MVEEVNQIKIEVLKHFSKIYTEEEWDMPMLDGVHF